MMLLFSVLSLVSIHMEMISQINLIIAMKYILLPFRHTLNTNEPYNIKVSFSLDWKIEISLQKLFPFACFQKKF